MDQAGRAGRWAAALGVLVLLACGPALAATPAAAETTAPISAPAEAPTSTPDDPQATGSPGQSPRTDPSTPQATGSVEATATTPAATPGGTPTVTVTVTTAAEPQPEASAGVLPGLPPALERPAGQPWSWAIAALVLIAGVIVALVLRGREEAQRPAPAPAAPTPGDADADMSAAKLAALEAVGEAMIDAGYSVTAVRLALEEMAEANGFPGTEIVVFPTALFVSARGVGRVSTGVVSSGQRTLTLAQIDALDDVITVARSSPVDPAEIVAGVEAARSLPPVWSRWQRLLGYSAATAGISVLLGASWTGVGIAALLGLLVAVVLWRTRQVQQQYQALITAGLAFVVSCTVLLIASAGLDPGVLPSLIAPLVTFLPGALLSTGVIELFTGQMMSGAGRLAAGLMRLTLLAAGIMAAAMMVGVPELELAPASTPIGVIGPWVAVAVFGVGIIVHQGGRRRSILWVLLVLYVAYGAQVLAGIFFGGVLSAFVGALAMTPVAALVARQPSGPAALVSFLPAFWLLVPGALGLVGVTSIWDGNSAGLSTLVTTLSTMVAIALGTLAGSAVSSLLAPSHRSLL